MASLPYSGGNSAQLDQQTHSGAIAILDAGRVDVQYRSARPAQRLDHTAPVRGDAISVQTAMQAHPGVLAGIDLDIGNGVWNAAGAAVSFTLQPHFYQTKWFIALAILSYTTYLQSVRATKNAWMSRKKKRR